MSFIEDDKVMASEIGSKEEMPFLDVLDCVKRYNAKASKRLLNETEN